MKQANAFKFKWISSIAIITLPVYIICISGCNEQKNNKEIGTSKYPPKPNMWVDKATSNKLEGNFNLQHFQLSLFLKKHNMGNDETDSIFYPIESFKHMIKYFDTLGNFNYLHVYIASYGADSLGVASSPPVPKGYGNKLTLVFAPSKDTFDNTNNIFYSITPTGTFNPSFDSCRFSNVDWMLNFKTKSDSVLIHHLDLAEKNNYDKLGNLTDTRRIQYDKFDIQQLMNEIDYQDSVNGKKISGIRAFFSSYSNSGRRAQYKFKNRIFVLFEFTAKFNELADTVFYIDDQPDFPYRVNALKTQPSGVTDVNSTKGNDNGQLCPPNCCPPPCRK